MGIAFAAWHWSPDQFLRATPHEYFAAYEVWQQLLKAQTPEPSI